MITRASCTPGGAKLMRRRAAARAGFMAQFGIAAEPAAHRRWSGRKLQDDPVRQKNLPGTLSFAMAGRNSRTTQLFVNLRDNSGSLDAQGFAPFAQVVAVAAPGGGTEPPVPAVLEQIHGGYGESRPKGDGPEAAKLAAQGSSYLAAEFPDLTYIDSIRREAEDVVSADGAAAPRPALAVAAAKHGNGPAGLPASKPPQPPVPQASWSVDEMAQWLRDICDDQLAHLAPLFERHHVDGGVAPGLTNEVLRDEIGVLAWGHRIKIVRCVRAMPAARGADR